MLRVREKERECSQIISKSTVVVPRHEIQGSKQVLEEIGRERELPFWTKRLLYLRFIGEIQISICRCA